MRPGYALLRAMQRTGLLSRLEIRTSVTHEGRKLSVPVLGGVGLEHWALTDAGLLPVIRAALRTREGAFVDVGAHIGETLLKLLAIGDRRPYVGIEPQPRAAAYLEGLLAANDHPGHVLAAAVGDRNGVAELRLSEELDDSASIVAGFRHEEQQPKRLPVPLVRGDEALALLEVGTIGVLKIDAEGAEIDVLEGIAATIERDRPIILCEILPIYDEATPHGHLRRSRSDAVLGFAAERGYASYRIGEAGLEHLVRIETHSELALREYALVPEEVEDGFRRELESARDPSRRS